MPIWTDSDFAGLPPAPKSSDPMDVARFVDQRVVAGNKAILKHMDKHFTELRREFSGAFPCDDPAESRRLLEALLHKEKRKAEFWSRVADRAAAGTLSSLIAALLLMIGLGLKEWLKS